MLPLVKIIIIAIVVVGVAAPTGYIAYKYTGSSSPDLAHFIPEGTSSVVSYNVNGTQAILFAGPQYAGVIATFNLTNLESGKTPYANNSLLNSSFGGKTEIHVNINQTYDGYNIYQITNITSAISGKNLTLPVNHSPYIGQISNSIVVIGNLSSVKASLNANHSGLYMKNLPANFDMKYTGMSFYFNTSSLNVGKYTNLTGSYFNSPKLTSHVIYGNMSAMSSNITITNLNSSQERNISIIVSTFIPANMTLQTSYGNGIYKLETSIGYKNFDYAVSRIVHNLGGYTS